MRGALALAVVALAAGATVSTAASAPATESHVVSIFAPRGTAAGCARVFPLRRIVTGPRVLDGAMRALLAGPTRRERARGFGGWFSGATAGRLRSVRIHAGVAHVDFRTFAALMPNASASCGSALLLAQLDRTARQFPAVKRAVYSFDGSRRAFYEWLQRVPPPD